MEKNTFDFSDVLRLLKEGKKVYRTENCYIYLVKGSVFEVSRPPLNDALPAGTKVIYGPHIDMLQKFPTGEICAWVWRASNLDMLADDWMEYGEEVHWNGIARGVFQYRQATDSGWWYA